MNQEPDSQTSQEKAPQEKAPQEKAPQEKVPLNEQIADILLKLIMTGGVAGGGFGAFWSLFKESDVPKAIASAGIGLGISYAARMLQPLHQGNQRRLENTGKVMDQAIDRMSETAIAKITAVEDRYFACQAAACETCATEGMAKLSGIFTPMLEDVFVSLELDRNSLPPGFRDVSEPVDPELCNPAQMERDLPTTVDIWKLLAKAKQNSIYRQIAILAWGGYGKTTLLRHIAYTLGKNKQPRQVRRFIPVLLLLRKHRDLLCQDHPPSLPEVITQHHIPSLPVAEGLQMPINEAREMLKQGKMVVLLDGFDEVPKPKRPLVARWLNAQMQTYQQSVFILTSRPKAYNEQESADRLDLHTLLYVRDFKPKQRQEFVQKWYWCQEYYHHGKEDIPAVRQVAREAAADLLNQIEQRQELADLTKNPLLLNMVAMFHRHDPSAQLPKRRVELYQQICKLLLKDRPGARNLETQMEDWEAAQTILQMLALEMMQQKEERLDRATLRQRLTRYLRDQEETIAASEFISQVEQISELIVQREPEEYEFAHLSFQEYLAAREVVRLQTENLLYDHLGEDWWKSVILLYAAQVKPNRLIRAALERGATDLAYTCWQETSKRIDADLQAELAELKALRETVMELQTSRCAQLEAYLRNQQWKDADQETYRLMITTVGKEVGQWFDREDLLNFPCEELLTIDRMWVEYSNGHFGFSVQKKIWIECGSPMEYNDEWLDFGDRVGWRKSGYWVSYEDFLPLNLFAGEFPCRVWDFGVVGLISSLVQRLVDCSTSQF